MTAREEFVKAMRTIWNNYDCDPHLLRALAVAFINAWCRMPGNAAEHYQHDECRTAFLRDCGLGEDT